VARANGGGGAWSTSVAGCTGGGGGGRVLIDSYQGVMTLTLEAMGGGCNLAGAGTVVVRPTDATLQVRIANATVAGSTPSVYATDLPEVIPGDLVLGQNAYIDGILTNITGTLSLPPQVVAVGILAVHAQSAVIAGVLIANSAGYENGIGPGCSSEPGCSHGGLGSGDAPGTLYDSRTMPFEGGSSPIGEWGAGGKVYIATTGPLVVTGDIDVSSSTPNSSGGTITLVGSSIEGGGTLSVRGGTTGGGGGRIALYGTLSAFTTVDVSGAMALGPSGTGSLVQAEHVALTSPQQAGQGDGTLAWTFASLPAGGTYRVYVNDEFHMGDAFNARLLDTGEPLRSVSTSDTTYVFSDLTPLRRYYWQVLALSADGGVVAGSEMAYFCTGAPCVMDISWPDGGPPDAGPDGGSPDAGPMPVPTDGPPVFMSQASPFARCGLAYSYQPTVGGQRPLTFSISPGPDVGLPPNVMVDATSGALTFTPDSYDDGVYSAVLSAQNDAGQAQQQIDISVFCSPPRMLNTCSCGFGTSSAVLCLLSLFWLRARRGRALEIAARARPHRR
jgi:hypothetical protein